MAGYFFPISAKKIQLHGGYFSISTDFTGHIEYPWTREEYPSETGDPPRSFFQLHGRSQSALPSLVRRTSSRRDGSGANFNPDLRVRITRGLVPSCQRKKGDDEQHRETGEESWIGGKKWGWKDISSDTREIPITILERIENLEKMGNGFINCFTETFFIAIN